jgi:hypothetical protein
LQQKRCENFLKSECTALPAALCTAQFVRSGRLFHPIGKNPSPGLLAMGGVCSKTRAVKKNVYFNAIATHAVGGLGEQAPSPVG